MTKAVSLARSVSDTGLLLDGDLAAIAALSGTTGLLKKDSANTWSLDTSSYLTGNQTLTFSGDATGTGTTAITITLANSGVSAGSYGSATNIPAITVDSKGRITSVTNTAVSIPSGSLTFTGDVTGSGSTGSSTSLTLASVGTAGTYTKVTTDAKGRVTSGGTLASGDLPTYTGTLTSSQITTALGYTPENLANKAAANGYASLDSSGKVPTAQLSGFVDQTKPSIRPTLNLDFANSKIVDSRITFTRTTTASYYDQQGILKYAQPDEPRIDYDPSTGECRGLLIEEQRTNLLTYSSVPAYSIWNCEYGAYWDRYVAIAPDGTNSASLLRSDGSSVSSRFIFVISSAGTWTTSFYVKQGASSATGFWVYANGSWEYTGSLIWTNGVPTWNTSGCTIQSVGNGWYRTSFTYTTTGAGTALISPHHYSQATNSSSTYFWGLQHETGAFATSYIPSTTTFTSRASSATYFDSTGVLRTAGVNQARYGYGYDSASGKWVSQGLVLEGAATNICVDSRTNLSWSIQGSGGVTSTINTSDTAAPDGSYTATKIDNTNMTNDTWSDYIYSNSVIYQNQTLTFSIYLKGTAGQTIQIKLDGNGGPGTYANVTLTGSWQRYSVTYTYGAAYNVVMYMRVGRRDLGSIGSTNATVFYLWGAQLETGYVATSYIPTYGATATRAADVSSSAATTRSQDKPSIGSVYMSNILNGLEGTVFSQGRFFGADASYNNPTIYIHDGTSNNYIALFGYANSYGWAQSSSGTQAGISGSATAINTEYRLGFAYKANNFAFVSNGGTVGTDTSGSVPVVNQVAIGYRMENQSVSYNGHIKKITYYPKRLSNTELQALTQ